MTEKKPEPEPGTYGAIRRSTEPWPWKKYLKLAMFTKEEFCERGPVVVFEKAHAFFEAVKKDGER